MDIYKELGCNKTDLSRWSHKPYSTHATSKTRKTTVISKAKVLFQLSTDESELLANKAGLSLSNQQNKLSEIVLMYPDKNSTLVRKAAVSERMFQYYLSGEKLPTKQVLLAIALSLDMPFDEIVLLLHAYGYHLSASLANDAVVLWFLTTRNERSAIHLLSSVNEVLAELALPLLMTQQMSD